MQRRRHDSENVTSKSSSLQNVELSRDKIGEKKTQEHLFVHDCEVGHFTSLKGRARLLQNEQTMKYAREKREKLLFFS